MSQQMATGACGSSLVRGLRALTRSDKFPPAFSSGGARLRKEL